MQYTIQNTESGNFSIEREGIGSIAKFETFVEAEEFMIQCGLCVHEHLSSGAVIATIEYAELGEITSYYGLQANKKAVREQVKAEHQELIEQHTPFKRLYRIDRSVGLVTRYPIKSRNQPIVAKKLETYTHNYTLSTGERVTEVLRTIYPYEIKTPLGANKKSYKIWLPSKEQEVSVYHNETDSQEIIRNTEALIDSAEAISRHIRLAKTLQADVLELNKHVLPAIRELDLSKAKPGEIASLIRAMADVLAKSTEIERKAMGLADPTQSHKIDIDIDLSKLSDAEIEQYKMLVQKTVAHATN